MQNLYKISLCMIVKDEEKDLPVCLASIKDAVDEIIIVDTGSLDNTINVAKDYNAKVIQAQWQNDFSLARNISLKNATCDWILWLDADDYIEPEQISKIKEIKLVKPDHAIGIKIKNTFHNRAGGQVFIQQRIFPRHKDIFFQGKIHEQVGNSLNALNIKTVISEIEVIHRGYDDPVKFRAKCMRNIKIIEDEIAKGNASPNTFYKYAGHLQDIGEFDKAVENYTKAIESYKGHHNEKIIEFTCRIKIIEINMVRNKMQKAITLIEDHINDFGETIENVCYYGVALFHVEDFIKAAIYLEKTLLMNVQEFTFVPIDEVLVKVNACKYLGMIYNRQNDSKNLHRILEFVKQLKK